MGGLDQVVSIGLDNVVLAGLDKSRLGICIDSCLVGLGATTELGLTTPNLDDPCFAFLWPR